MYSVRIHPEVSSCAWSTGLSRASTHEFSRKHLGTQARIQGADRQAYLCHRTKRPSLSKTSATSTRSTTGSCSVWKRWSNRGTSWKLLALTKLAQTYCWLEATKMGYSDVQIAACWKGEKRTSAGIVPYSKQIDTLAATFTRPHVAVCTMKS